jgi:hypothetical protein
MKSGVCMRFFARVGMTILFSFMFLHFKVISLDSRLRGNDGWRQWNDERERWNDIVRRRNNEKWRMYALFCSRGNDEMAQEWRQNYKNGKKIKIISLFRPIPMSFCSMLHQANLP